VYSHCEKIFTFNVVHVEKMFWNGGEKEELYDAFSLFSLPVKTGRGDFEKKKYILRNLD
jgi:hypothetical protein